MKFATIKSLFVALTILSIISLSLTRRSSSKSKARVNDATNLDAKLVEYETTLSINDGTTNTDHKIKIDQESFNKSTYGIQFALETGAITNPAFFLVAANTYFFNFKHVHAFNCLNQATFTTKNMHFSAYLNKKTYDIVFTFPNAWAFGATVNLLSLCDKFSNKWTATATTRNHLETEIMKSFSHIKLLEMNRAANKNTKEGLQAQNTDLDANIKQMEAAITAQRASINTISAELNTIAAQSQTEGTKLENLENQIRENQAKLVNQQEFIDNTNTNIDDIRQIQDSEITNEWNSFKVSLTNMIELQSSVDPLRDTLVGYQSNCKANVASIMSALNL